MRISSETIYKWVYALKKQGENLWKYLRMCRKTRRKRRDGISRRGVLTERKLIQERPHEVERKAVIGHWEGDTVEGQKGTGYLVTNVERVTSYTVIAQITNKKAETLNQAAANSLKELPDEVKKTLTVDNGTEFSGHKQLEVMTKMDVYFADPYASWQRGLNENTNGLLRQYFPKGMDFRKLTKSALAKAVHELNHRPRKKLKFKTPHEVLFEYIVALEG